MRASLLRRRIGWAIRLVRPADSSPARLVVSGDPESAESVVRFRDRAVEVVRLVVAAPLEALFHAGDERHQRADPPLDPLGFVWGEGSHPLTILCSPVHYKEWPQSASMPS